MAAVLQTFGGGTTDFILDPGNGAKPLPNTPYTVIDGQTMLPATGLVDASGVTVTQLSSDADGRYAGGAMLQGVTYYLDAVGAKGPFRAGPQVSTTALANVVAMGPQLDTIASSAAASAFAAQQAQAAAEAVQTGSATTNASLLTSGTVAAARLPDLSGTYASASALSTVTTTANTASTTAGTAKSTADTAKSTADTALSTANATQTQQTALMASSATIDELTGSVRIGEVGGTAISGSSINPIWVAPFPCKLVAATLVFQSYAQALSATNYIEIAFRRVRGGGATSDFIVSKKTSAEAIAALTPWKYAGAAWNATNQVLDEGDVITLNTIFTGAPTAIAMPMIATFRYTPL